jgi:drug/metabolite transporter (DMT)-like permease
MAAYVGLAFLSFLWGSSFLLIKIASRAFDPFDFALARVGVAAAAMLMTSAIRAGSGLDRDRGCGPNSSRSR